MLDEEGSLRIDVDPKIRSLDVGRVRADAPAFILGHVDFVQPEDDVGRGGVGTREGEFGRGGDLGLEPGVVVLGAPLPDLDVWVVLGDFEPAGAGAPDGRVRPAVEMDAEAGGEDLRGEGVESDSAVFSKVHGIDADGQVGRLGERSDEVDLGWILGLGLLPRSDLGGVEGVLVDDALRIHFSNEGFITFRQDSVPADGEAVCGQFRWDGIFHYGGGIERGELRVGGSPLGEDLGVDFGMTPAVVDEVVIVHGVPVPWDGGCGALMLVNATEGVTELVDNSARKLIVWGVIIEPAKVHRWFVGGNAEVG